jgi:hypothetical protein
VALKIIKDIEKLVFFLKNYHDHDLNFQEYWKSSFHGKLQDGKHSGQKNFLKNSSVNSLMNFKVTFGLKLYGAFVLLSSYGPSKCSFNLKLASSIAEYDWPNRIYVLIQP